METRSRARQEPDAISDTPMALDVPLERIAPTLTQNTPQSAIPQPNMGWHMDPNDLPLEHPIEFMRQLESIGWNGGEHFFPGKHDEFCFVCGGSMELFGCQTCETCYHAACMSPTLEVDDVPTFWFCPHCVDRELHIPPDLSTSYLTPMSPPQPGGVYPSPSQSSLGQASTPNSQPNAPAPLSKRKPEGQMIDIKGSKQKIHEIARSLNNATLTETRKEPKADLTKAPSGRSRRTNSPPRKRSKYSAYSSEVDKALAVIHKELEAAAQNGKSEGSLRERIHTLEQELRLKDGQILLSSRELEVARQQGDTARLQAEVKELRAQNEGLKTLVEKKDAELRDWRSKLKTLLGNDAE
ncbi:uncharacterized protein LY89DRAFT_736001 [Mollisia scopiformis]|uniref:PHD-type domain-containing protein n=1 Tax=Mollisia scopiformis TaxID=149040 RepID=A0A194X4G1_MOLSC|nr:uncharacterized protein LY89DRAFT_736001 [Mollisia scopiformis]KUJ14944.1 hypothetical protein LY89DRAFT_736001 [Mollisia scopiformis]